MNAIDQCIAEGNIRCASCLSGGILTERQKERLVEAAISLAAMPPETKAWIDNHSHREENKSQAD